MTLVTLENGHTRLVECPFCGTALAGGRESGERAASHLRLCRRFHEAWGHDARGRSTTTSAGTRGAVR